MARHGKAALFEAVGVRDPETRAAAPWTASAFAVRKDAGVSASPGSVGEFNWGGAGGTYFRADPREDLFVVHMMQSPKQRVPYRGLLKAMVCAAITRPAGKQARVSRI